MARLRLAILVAACAACTSEVPPREADAGTAANVAGSASKPIHTAAEMWACEQRESCRIGGGTPQRERVAFCLGSEALVEAALAARNP
jgi:hypothetical protein